VACPAFVDGESSLVHQLLEAMSQTKSLGLQVIFHSPFDELGGGQSSPPLVKVDVKSNNIIRAVGTTRYQRETHDFTPTNSDPTLPKSPT
jgi:hypothetical protein